MDHAQGRIAVLYRIYNDADRKQIVNLIQRLLLVYHLLVDTEKMFNPSVDLGFDTGGPDMLAHILHNTVDKSLPFISLQSDLLYQIIIDLRLQILQGKVIQLNFDFRNSQPVAMGA